MYTHQELNSSTLNSWFAMDTFSPGSPIFLPPGMFVFQQLQNYLRKYYKRNGYVEVLTPDLWKNKLWKMTGHSDNYSDNMFSICNNNTINGINQVEGNLNQVELTNDSEMYDNQFRLKPMNCGGHYRIFAQQPRYYTELPLRIAEFGTVHRNEVEGSLRGLFRVRKFHQDDAHIFCANDPDQISTEIRNFLKLLDETYRLFGFEYTLELSTRPESSLGSDDSDAAALWSQSEDILKTELERSGKHWNLNEGDGAFYGPKIDVHLTDSLGRSHQCGTIQLDLQIPKKMNVTYADPTGKHQRPVVLHRAVFGSLERFIGILIEHFQGKLPLWLSYKQILICSLFKKDQSETQLKIKEYVKDLKNQLLDKNWELNVDIDNSDSHIKQKIKSASEHGYHYVIVIGDKETVNQQISIRSTATGKIEYGKTLSDFMTLI